MAPTSISVALGSTPHPPTELTTLPKASYTPG